jgi:hypothetical protein
VKQINKVKWYKTTERKPNRDCKVILLNSVIEFVGIFRNIVELKWSKKYQALNCNENDSKTAIELGDYEYWCYADDFYKQFERAGIYAEI